MSLIILIPQLLILSQVSTQTILLLLSFTTVVQKPNIAAAKKGCIFFYHTFFLPSRRTGVVLFWVSKKVPKGTIEPLTTR